MYVTGEGPPYRQSIAVWLELPDALVLAIETPSPQESAGAVGRALAKALRSPLIGEPRRPTRVRVEDPSLAREIRAELGADVPIEIAPTPELDAFVAEMASGMPESDEEESYFEDGRVPEPLVAFLFQCAERLYRVAPWKGAAGDLIVRLDIPELGVNGACAVVIGSLGESFGLLVFPSFAAFDAFEAAASEPPSKRDSQGLGTELLSLEFERGAALPASLRREVAKHGWPVASAAAYPRVSVRERDGVLRPLEARDVQIAALGASALASFCMRGPIGSSDAPPRSESFADEHAYGATTRVTAPYEAFDLFADSADESSAPTSSEPLAPKTSRNAPCPCGSGKKYKRCHLPIEEAQDAPRRRAAALHALDSRLVRAVTEFAARRYGERFTARWDEFAAGDRLVLAIPFSAYASRVDGESVLDCYLRERGKRLSGEERGWLESQREAWLSVWEVISVAPNEGATLRDLLSGEQRSVRDVSASRTLLARDGLLGRVIDHAGLSLLCGVHPRTLAPADAAGVVVAARKRLRSKALVSAERLRDEEFARALITLWERRVKTAERRAARPVALSNTDGDPLLLTADHFEFDPALRGSVEDRIASIAGAEREGEAEPGASSFVFVVAGNRKHRSWDNTIVGHAEMSEARLRLETNSRKRADALRERVEAACGRLIRHRTREHADPLSDKAPRADRQPQSASPEHAQLVLDFKAAHYRAWLDEALPALAGKTPREAARSASGRSSLDVLLKEMENQEARVDRGEAFDFSVIRRELGLD